jgi:hypothetical protein
MGKDFLYDYLVGKLKALQEEKAGSSTYPNMVTKAELFKAIDKDIKAVLNQMFREKKIKVHKTIHAPLNDFVELVKEK